MLWLLQINGKITHSDTGTDCYVKKKPHISD